jgi:hypothetical protein
MWGLLSKRASIGAAAIAAEAQVPNSDRALGRSSFNVVFVSLQDYCWREVRWVHRDPLVECSGICTFHRAVSSYIFLCFCFFPMPLNQQQEFIPDGVRGATHPRRLCRRPWQVPRRGRVSAQSIRSSGAYPSCNPQGTSSSLQDVPAKCRSNRR